NVVRTKRTVVIGIGFTIGNGVKFFKCLTPSRVVHSHEQFVLSRIIIIRTREGNTIPLIVSQTHSEAISLHLIIPLSLYPWMLGGNAAKNTARRISRYFVRTNIRLKPVLMVQYSGLNSVPLLSIHTVCLPPHMEAYAGRRHQVAFVGGIDKGFTGKGLSTQRG